MTYEERVARLRELADNAQRSAESGMDPGRGKAAQRDADAWRLIASCLEDLSIIVTGVIQ